MAHPDPDAGQVERVAAPWLRIVRGAPTDVEIAAVVAVLAARASGAAGHAPPSSLWRNRTALVHAPLLPGRGSWRASGQPTHR